MNEMEQHDLGSPELELPDIAPASTLTTVVPGFDFAAPPADPLHICRLLYQLHQRYKGYGLSANQFGLPYRALIFGDPFEGLHGIMFNPVIVYREGECVEEEGCLSFPHLSLRVSRAKSIRVRYQKFTGAVDTARFSGMTARVVQHEVDHLDGIPFINRVSRLRYDIAARKASKQKGRQA
jgi:peptide deformylase